MRGLLLGLALVFVMTGSAAFAEMPERKGGELSALDSLKATAELTGGVLDVGDRAIDILGIVVPPELTKYWEGMRISDALFGTDKKSGENVYILALSPLDGRTDMPRKAQAIYLLENTGKQDKRSGKPLFRVGAPIDFVVSDKPQEIPNGPMPKSNDRCTIDRPCDEMRRQAPCPHHDKGKCEHMEKHNQDQQKKDRGIAI